MIFRYKYIFSIPKNIAIENNIIGDNSNFSFFIEKKVEDEDNNRIEGYVLKANGLKESEEVAEEIKSFLNNPNIKLITIIDGFNNINYSEWYHGTTKESFNGVDNYIFVTNDLSHAVFHANSKSKDNNENPLVVKISLNEIKIFDYLPDNDIDESNGYKYFLESIEDIGSFILKGSISSDIFKKVSYKNSEHLENLVRDIHRDSNDFHEGDILERIHSVDSYELANIDLSLLNLDEWVLDEDLIEEYSNLNIENQPPIIIHKFNDNWYSIVDGIHRANVAKLKGLKTIKAYIGIKY